MQLHALKPRNNRKKGSKRVGRGYGSGKGGHTCGRGMKGQKSRSGYKKKPGFEGGNVPLFRRLPKYRGFNNPTRVEYEPVNLSDLETHYKDGEEVSLKTLREKGLIKKRANNVKILGKGKLSKKLVFSGVVFSSKARELIEKLGGKVK